MYIHIDSILKDINRVAAVSDVTRVWVANLCQTVGGNRGHSGIASPSYNYNSFVNKGKAKRFRVVK